MKLGPTKKNKNMRCLYFCVCVASLTGYFLDHLPKSDFTTLQFWTVYITHTQRESGFKRYLSVEFHLGCFHVLAVVSNIR